MSTSISMKDITTTTTSTITTTTTARTTASRAKTQEKQNLHIYHAENACLRCGRKGHFSSACYVKKNKYGEAIESDSEYNSE